MSGRRVGEVLAAALALVAFLIMLGTNARTSATWDEPFYLAEGLGWWGPHDYRMIPEAPPLPAVLGTAAVLSLKPEMPLDDPSWIGTNSFVFPDVLVNRNAHNRTIAREIFFRARVPIALVGALGIGLVFVWARRLSNDVGGVVAAALLAFSPSWLAHSSVFTTDVVASVTIGAVVAYASFLPARTSLGWRPALALGALVFLALASKFTALVLGPLLPASAVGSWWLLRRSGRPGAPLLDLARAHVHAAVAAMVLLVAILYPGESGLTVYTKGLSLLYKSLDPDARYYFCGSYSTSGWPSFGVVSLVMKSPTGSLVLGVGGSLLAIARLREKPQLLAPLLLIALIIGVSALDKAAFGVRRVLPAIPPLVVLAGVGVGALVEPARTSRTGTVGLALAGVLVLSNVASCVRAYPDYLPYMNELEGGSAHAWESFADSNVDWGQALPQVQSELEKIQPPPAHVKILYFGRVDPEIYGVHAETAHSQELAKPDPGTLYICSVTRLHRARAAVLEGDLPVEADWLTRRTPTARAGDSIFLYAIPEAPR